MIRCLCPTPDKQNRKLTCQSNSTGHECDDNSGNFAPQVILFLAQLISGVGGSLYYTLGVSYMDDNIKKSKTPALVSKGRWFGSCTDVISIWEEIQILFRTRFSIYNKKYACLSRPRYSENSLYIFQRFFVISNIRLYIFL